MSAAPQHFSELAQQPPRRLRNSSFVNCGVAGFAVAAVLSHLLILRVGLSPWIQFVCGVTAAVGLLGTALAVKVFTGEDGFVFYRDAITALVFVGIVLHSSARTSLPRRHHPRRRTIPGFRAHRLSSRRMLPWPAGAIRRAVRNKTCSKRISPLLCRDSTPSHPGNRIYLRRFSRVSRL